MTARRWTETAGTEVVRQRAGGLCEVGIPTICTIRAGAYEGEFSHRRSKKQSGAWDPRNGCRACPPCHLWIEGHWESAVEHGLRVPSWEDPIRTPVYLRLQPWWSGWWWLLEDGTYDSAWALDAALALGFPEVPTPAGLPARPDLPEWASTTREVHP